MIYILLFLLVIISGFSVFLLKDESGIKNKLLLSFSGAYLLAISFLHLIPEIFKSTEDNFIGIYILLGFFIQILLEYFSKGIEHGHSPSTPQRGEFANAQTMHHSNCTHVPHSTELTDAYFPFAV